LFLVRGPLVRWAIEKKVTSFNQRHHANLQVNHFSFTGIVSFQIDSIMLAPENGDTLMNIKDLNINLSLFKLFAGRIRLNSLEAHLWQMNFVRQDSLTNYMFLIKSNKPNSAKDTLSVSSVDYADKFSVLLKAMFDIIPEDVKIDSLSVTSMNNQHWLQLSLNQFNIEDGKLDFPLTINENDSIRYMHFKGEIDSWSNSADIKLYAPEGKAVVPFIHHRWEADMRFDTLHFILKRGKWRGGALSVNGEASCSGLEFYHKRVATDTIIFEHGKLNYKVNVGSNYFELDSASQVTFNRLIFNPYVKFTVKPEKELQLKIYKDKFPAQDLFGSLPEGIFSTLQGIETEGELSYYLNVDINFAHPDNLIFEQSLDKHNFHIKKFGRVAYPYINQPFSYTAYEHGVPVKTFEVGPGYGNFRTLDQIPEILKNSVLTSEDGSFFWHHGFLIDAFRESIAENIKKGRFARGGSTITMQLVKNLFLTRNKTVSRKAEEALIVWLIENNGLCSKNRMFEIYLNIIEWGPMVYGAEQASRFYFNKDVQNLTLPEAIYMASIIPRPKAFKYCFDSAGHLRPYLKGYYDLMSKKLLGHGKITQEMYDQLLPDVTLTGPAKNLVIHTDSIASDSLFLRNDDPEIFNEESDEE
jgi:hypothetical protein